MHYTAVARPLTDAQLQLRPDPDYDRYCERHRLAHPQAPVPTRREYEVLRTRQQELRPGSRCC
jgi:uncharacterized short protein YbdD (DUF466 family)